MNQRESPHAALLLGRAHKDGLGDLDRALAAPRGNETIRTLGCLLPKVLRHCAEAVTFDRSSFERAVAGIPADAVVVLAPSHRSYFDFLLTSYLCFAHPELRIAPPHIAAAEEFGTIPVVGSVLRRAHAFYLKRGSGGRREELDAELRRVVDDGGSLMFFIEGQRSRSRHTLAPKRGLLRALQATGRRFAILPISIAYERLPEELSFERELSGGRRSRMYLSALLRWLGRLSRGEEHMGAIHLACSPPVLLDETGDVGAIARDVVAAQQRTTAVTEWHLRTFIEEAPWLGLDVNWLARAIEARGGRVLPAGMPVPREPSAVLRQSLRNQWMPFFFGDAQKLLSDDHAVLDHIRRRGFFEGSQVGECDANIRAIVEELFVPVRADYALTRRALRSSGGNLAFSAPVQLVRAYPSAHLPHIEDAFAQMVENGQLSRDGSGAHSWTP